MTIKTIKKIHMNIYIIRFTNLITIIVAFSLVYACSGVDINAANKTISNFYLNYKPGDYRVVDKRLLSATLIEKIEAAALKQKEDASRLKSIGSTDKPLMIEGDIYTSLMEGTTSHQIVHAVVDNNTVKAEVKFTNQYYNKTWSDTVLLIQEDNHWKIDDIFYTSQQGGGQSTKGVLDAFLHLPNQ
jgi:hypothetical protein